MRKLTGLIVLLLCSYLASAETYIPGASVFGKLGRNITWTSGVNNTWVIDAISPTTGICVTIQNNDTASHNFSLVSYLTSDQAQTVLGTGAKWQQIALSPPASSGSIFTVAASSVLQIYARTVAAFHIAFQFSGGSGTGTADLIFAQTGASCGSTNYWTATGSAAGQNVTIVAGVAGVKHVLQCFTWSVSGTVGVATNNLQFSIRTGDASGNCTGGSSIPYIDTISFPIGTTSQRFGLCNLNIAAGTGQNIVACFSAAVTNIVQDTFLSGYDSQ
jgi:hypothetical protein